MSSLHDRNAVDDEEVIVIILLFSSRPLVWLEARDRSLGLPLSPRSNQASTIFAIGNIFFSFSLYTPSQIPNSEEFKLPMQREDCFSVSCSTGPPPRFSLGRLLRGFVSFHLSSENITDRTYTLEGFSDDALRLQNADAANFSIYIHSEPGFVFDASTTRSGFFFNRQLTNTIKVAWGEASMIQAERLLLDAALEDPANQRFVLLSDSCVPLYNFSYVYSYLLSSSSRSFVDSFHDKKEGRYNPKMSNVIPRNKWRKGSQWFTLTRRHAEVVVDDDVVYPVFKKLCRRRPSVDPSKGKENIKLQKQHNCIPDEHYLPTLFAMSELEHELERRTVTYTQWNESTSGMETNAWHPVTFGYGNVGPEQIKKIQDIKQIYYETDSRTEVCHNNLTSVPCFLFARKFSRAAAMRLLSEGVTGRFDPTRLLGSSRF